MGIVFLVGRLILGGYFIWSGFGHFDRLSSLTGYAASKNIPLPKTAVAVSGLVLIAGGLSIFLGIFVNVGILLLVLFLVAVSYAMHDFWDVKDPALRIQEMIGFSKNMALVGALCMITMVPQPWILSLF